MVSPWIHTTDKCNLACSYCHVKGNEIMQKPIYDALSRMLPKDAHLRMGGGEPLLVYDNWKDWCLQWQNTEVLTNFRVIPDGYFDMPFRTSVSIDGHGEKPLDGEIIKNVAKLKIQPWIMTTASNVTNLPLLAEYISQNNYGWALSTDYFWAGIPTIKDLILAMQDVINILKLNNYDFDQFLFNNLDFIGRGGCCAGNEMFSVNCDGRIYPCQTCHGKSKPLGEVFSGYNKITCKKDCPDCSIKGLCTGWCPLYHTPNSDICNVMKFVTLEVYNAK